MSFTQQQIIDQMKETGLVPLFTHDQPEEAFEVVQAAYRGGIRAFEFTNRRLNSYEVFQYLVSRRQELPGLMLGIGTIMDAPMTEKFIDAGADFIISPILKLSMADVCRQQGILWIPGCATPTEVVTAKENGAGVIKIFPGAVVGPVFVSSIMPVVPGLHLMITGGVETNEQNLSAWFRAGSTCVGMGSNLFTKEILQARDWNKLKERVEEILATIRKVRQG